MRQLRFNHHSSMSHVSIRDLEIHDQKKYKEFFLSALVSDPQNFRMSYDDELQSSFPTTDKPDSFTIGAYVGDALAGVVSFERDGATREKLRHKGILFRMFVSPHYRGLGIAKYLIDSLLHRAKELSNIEQINLTVVSHNQTAKKLYSSYGFTKYSEEKNAIKWKGNYATEEQMVCYI